MSVCIFKNFQYIAEEKEMFSDESVEIGFWLLMKSHSEKCREALDILDLHRDALAHKIAMTILLCETNEKSG